MFEEMTNASVLSENKPPLKNHQIVIGQQKT